MLEVSTRNRWVHPALIKDETTSSKQPSYLMNMCRKETNDWKENEERDLEPTVWGGEKRRGDKGESTTLG